MKATIVLLGGLLFAACAVPKGSSVEEKRASVAEMSREALADFYATDPRLKLRVRRAPGYGVFSNRGMKILLFGSGQGYGLVVDNKSGDKTYMRMRRFGGGVGMGFKDSRTLLLFSDRQAMRDFFDEGREVSGDADAAFKVGDEGGSARLGMTVKEGVTIYHLTKSGVAAEAMVYGARYTKDEELN